MNAQQNDYRGFSLFNDIEDIVLRNRNRAVVLANIAEDHSEAQRINGKGAALILGYFGLVPPNERQDVQDRFKDNMIKRGFLLVGDK